MIPVTSESDIGDPVTLTSVGNHSPENWAQATAQIIFNLDSLPPEKMLNAIDLQYITAGALRKYYHAVIERESENLQTFPDQCDTQYDVAHFAELAVAEIQMIAEGSLWEALVHFTEWATAAYETIANHLATAMHVERLLFCDANPTNPSAVAYKTRFFGITS